jgi:FMN phosphatase YigB (HAD superfamily)
MTGGVGFIFDMGNVLSLNVDVLPSVAAKLGVAVDQIVELFGDDFEALLVGSKTPQEVWAAFNSRFGTDVREDLLTTFFDPVTDARVERLILDLRRRGHRVVCGTNCFESHYLHHLRRGQYAVFDKVYASHIMKVAKPSPLFFEHILREEGWRPAETCFIDDREPNVAAARSRGIPSLLYESFEGLKAWLVGKEGIDGPP